MSDSEHLYFAHKTNHFVTKDESTKEKAEFIYRVFIINTAVIGKNKFVSKFS